MKKNFKRRDFLKKAGIGGAAAATPAFFIKSRLLKFFFICPPEKYEY
mgnify:CR=1 FL=1